MLADAAGAARQEDARARTLRDLGEAGLLRRLLRRLGGRSGAVLVGPGDDAAVVEASGRLILTCDMLVEGVHFRRATTPPADLGHKALAVNVSDVAAMGGRPLWALVSLALPGDLAVEFVDELYAGLLAAAGLWDVAVVGGDTVGSVGGVVVDVVVVGEVLPGGPFLAGAARPGDAVLCTGSFGAAAAGLLMLEGRLALTGGQAGEGMPEEVVAAVLAHRRPAPRLGEAAALAGLAAVHGFTVAARDASDGLAAAARAIAEASGRAVVLDAAAVPVAPAAALAERAGLCQALEIALYGGEDYELVFSLPADLVEEARQAVAAVGAPVTVVGRVEAGEGVFIRWSDGRREPLPERGFSHFEVPAVEDGAGGVAARGGRRWVVETDSPGETRHLGERLGRLLEPGDVVALTGPLGAGKTTFALGVLAGLGAEEDEGSPSFVLVNAYQGRVPAYHVDLYRLGERAAEEDLGWDELLGGPGVAIVEWAEYLGDLLPAERVEVRLERGAGEVRRINVAGKGRRGRALAEALRALARA